MYKKVSTDLNFVPREQEVLQFWKENRIFEASLKHREGAKPFTFFDGPPTANGKPHIGHVLTRAIKDLIPRYRLMKGYDVLRKAGWDTHGLPVEIEVEKQLGLDGKEQIEAYGIEPFIQACRESVWKYKGEWEQMSERVGFWADMEHPYVTYEDEYIESVWWSLKQIHEKGLLYKGHKVLPYCPRCGTALSSHEVAQGYKDVKEVSAIARFFCKDDPALAILAWTTTPWTLPSNVALCVNARESYVEARLDGARYILAEALVPSVLGEEAEIVRKFPGESLVGREYQPLFELPVNFGGKKGYRVVADEYVTLSEGTGVVHIAPAFGEDDGRIGKREGLPFVQFVASNGQMCGGTPWDGLFVKDADKEILKTLKESGKLFKTLPFEHSYPFCWRCDTPLIYYARESWFVEMTKVREQLVANNRHIHWIPESIKEGRMGNFVENVIDWSVSRERYWGTPLPVWLCDCGHQEVIGGREELIKKGIDVPEDLELHRPYIDAVEIPCPVCGKHMKREPVVIDCWYDAGSMPFAQWHYPFENQEVFRRRYPADFISEAIDQTRGWFYSLLAISTCLFDDVPSFENCIVLGHVQDMEGRKMSKHIGNVVDPWDVLNVQGADAVRWYFYTSSMPWLPSRFSAAAVAEAQRKFIGTFWNTYAFYVLYAELDGFDPTEHPLSGLALSEMDRWILSRLNSLIGLVDTCLDQYKITEAGRALQDFADELSNWYVRRCRDRFWGADMSRDKIAAYRTLYTCLRDLALLAAPFLPFMSEMIYQNIVRSVDKDAPMSVHLMDFPAPDDARIDKTLEADMARVLDIVTLGRAARSHAAVKTRQPLGRLYVQDAPLAPRYAAIIAEELNVKECTFMEDATELIRYEAKPQLKTLGPKYGKLLPAIGAYLKDHGDEVVRAVQKDGQAALTLSGTELLLTMDDLIVSTAKKDGLASESDQVRSVVLDTNLTPALIDEGFVREIVSKVQTMRKSAGLEVSDHIALSYEGSAKILGILERYGKDIARETLADKLYSGKAEGFVQEWDINGETATLGVSPVLSL